MTTIKPRTTAVIIYQGDDLERLGELRMAAETADRIARQAKGSARVGDEVSAQPAKDAYDDFVREAAERATVVTLTIIGNRRFRELRKEHPARETVVDGAVVVHEDDAEFDVNTETFPDALLTYRDQGRQTIVDPEFPTRQAVQDFLDDDISEGDYERLWVAAYWLNKALGSDPKALVYSLETSSSSGT